ncbi:shikimate dehydrogenase [Hyphobacterium sp. HN65]|uniref:Shikimate dehydrogenase (NADP(+)) n=1 Tax=Hyphobacterium lacteum TaxID=3116575 RepID=A0ABU7LRT6_9PROT|nr:shikimate dehydrogenase [Hyphobacterium sp. HN65]MEE2526632.1 shikimate dehydrogenase [Hyphobacterium sp. HN65]
MISGRTRIAGVIGSPIAHSLSPLLMNSWIAAQGLDAAYIALPAARNFGADDFRALARSGLAGLNVTLPFKTLALEVADEANATAIAAGAANLLLFRDGRIAADNTDIEGVSAALSEAGCGSSGKSVLVLGAGGVARAVCVAAQAGGARTIIIANRTRERAATLSRMFRTARSTDWSERQAAAREADIIVNATSLGLDGVSDPQIDWQTCKSGTLVFDTVYTPSHRPFMDSARSAGLRTVDGLSMLIAQARPSFTALFGSPVPDAPDAEDLLRKALSS